MGTVGVVRKIRPQVRHDLHPQAQQRPVPLDRGLDVYRMTATVERQHILPALLHPLHRTAQAHSQVGDDQLFGVHTALFAKTAADVRRHHTHTVLRSMQQRGYLSLTSCGCWVESHTVSTSSWGW